MTTKIVKNLKMCLHRSVIIPVNLMFKLTIPISEPERWHRTLASVQPFFCVIAFLLLLDSKYFDSFNGVYFIEMNLSDYRQKLAIGASLILGLVIRLKTYNLKAPELGVFWAF